MNKEKHSLEDCGIEYVWVFNGKLGHFPSAIFSSKAKALAWIGEKKLTGTLTKYPIDISVYDWTISTGHFTPKNEFQKNARTIENFNSAYMEHYHIENGDISD